MVLEMGSVLSWGKRSLPLLSPGPQLFWAPHVSSLITIVYAHDMLH